MRQYIRSFALSAALGLGSLAAFAAPGLAQEVLFGAEAMYGTDTDLGLGGRVAVGLAPSVPQLELQGGFNLFFPDGDVDFWELNANLWYQIDARGTTATPYVGGGLNIARFSRGDVENTDAGLNLGGGVKLPFENTTVFFEGRFTVAGVAEQFIIGGGVLFGG